MRKVAPSQASRTLRGDRHRCLPGQGARGGCRPWGARALLWLERLSDASPLGRPTRVGLRPRTRKSRADPGRCRDRPLAMRSWDPRGPDAPVGGVPTGCRAVALGEVRERDGAKVEVRDRRRRLKTTEVMLLADPAHPVSMPEPALTAFAAGAGSVGDRAPVRQPDPTCGRQASGQPGPVSSHPGRALVDCAQRNRSDTRTWSATDRSPSAA